MQTTERANHSSSSPSLGPPRSLHPRPDPPRPPARYPPHMRNLSAVHSKLAALFSLCHPCHGPGTESTTFCTSVIDLRASRRAAWRLRSSAATTKKIEPCERVRRRGRRWESAPARGGTSRLGSDSSQAPKACTARQRRGKADSRRTRCGSTPCRRCRPWARLRTRGTRSQLPSLRARRGRQRRGRRRTEEVRARPLERLAGPADRVGRLPLRVDHLREDEGRGQFGSSLLARV